MATDRVPRSHPEAPAPRGAGALLAISVVALNLLTGLAAAQPDGATVFGSNCSTCHQSNGEGLAGTFPPLAGVVPRIATAENGRTTLIRIVLFGLRGEITVMGTTYDGNMPAWGPSLSDAEIAAVLNHELTSWGNGQLLPDGFEPISEADVSAERSADLSPADVHEAWLELDPSGLSDGGSVAVEGDGK